jgi:hypothetical protein
MVSGLGYFPVILQRLDADNASGIRCNWDERILPKLNEQIDMFWSHNQPDGWDNGTYRVMSVRSCILDAEPGTPRSQPAHIAVDLELVT